MPVTGTVAVGLAAALDAIVGEPPERVHPVALFGSLVARADCEWGRPRLAGLVIAATLPLLAGAGAGGLVALAALADPWLASLVGGLVLFAAISLRMLLLTGARVLARSTDDLPAARAALPALVGRDPKGLSAGEVRSAAVESLAENLADGLVAPLLAFVLGALVSLPVAAAGAAWMKAVNTCDSMLGYETRPVGWASARLDDAVMWLPARVTAVLLALAALDPGALRAAKPWARAPASPNSGWPMATLAATADLRLRKPGAYDLDVGEALPDPAVARRARRTVGVAGALAVALAGVVAWF